jgi:hypothetical protein
MNHDFDNTSHLTHQILDFVETKMMVALVPIKLLDFMCVYPSTLAQDSSSKFEMN